MISKQDLKPRTILKRKYHKNFLKIVAVKHFKGNKTEYYAIFNFCLLNNNWVYIPITFNSRQKYFRSLTYNFRKITLIEQAKLALSGEFE